MTRFKVTRASGPAPQQFVDLDTLDDLLAFQAEHGKLIVSTDPLTDEPHIEIYDGYRE